LNDFAHRGSVAARVVVGAIGVALAVWSVSGLMLVLFGSADIDPWLGAAIGAWWAFVGFGLIYFVGRRARN
jgi:hypothetical protein